MRTFKKSVIFCGVMAMVGLTRCGPVASSLQKGVPGLGSIGSSDPTGDSSLTKIATVVPDTSASVASVASSAKPADASAVSKKDAPDYGTVSVTIGVHYTAAQIQSMNISQLPLLAVAQGNNADLTISQQGAGPTVGPLVQAQVSSVVLKVGDSVYSSNTDSTILTKFKNDGMIQIPETGN